MRKKTALVLLGVVVSFFSLIGVVTLLSRKQIVSIELAMLMCVALFGLYVGFGVLIVVYRLILKLD